MIEIIRAEAEHISEISEIERACFSDPWSLRSLEEELDAGGFFAAAFENGRVLGFAILRPMGEGCELLNIASAPEKRRRGIGKRLLEAGLEYASEAGMERIWLEVRAGNVPAIALYKSFGFKAVGRRKRYYTAPVEDAVLMEKVMGC